jgi:hypothetical protein
MKIMDKIKKWSEFVSTPEGVAHAARIQREAVEAVLKGIGTPEWERYMRNFHSNSQQLQRLTGQDEKFMQSTWGPLILAYIAGDALCGGGTTVTTGRNMGDKLKAHLESGLSTITSPEEINPIPPDLEPFI